MCLAITKKKEYDFLLSIHLPRNVSRRSKLLPQVKQKEKNTLLPYQCHTPFTCVSYSTILD
jgi:hypothetical protein